MDERERAEAWAKSMGYEGVEFLRLKSGKHVWLLKASGRIGLQRYIEYVGDDHNGSFILCSDEEAFDLFNEPNYMREG